MDNGHKKVLLLGASFGTGNMGVGALTAGALTILAKRYPRAEVALLDYGRESEVTQAQVGEGTMRVPLINLRFSWKVLLPNNVAWLLLLSLLMKPFGAGLRRRLMQRNRWLRAVGQADLAVAVSGGDSFSDIYGLGRFFYVMLPQLLVASLGKPLILLPQTLGPFKGRLARSMARYLVRRAELVYSRDPAGVAQARALLGLGDNELRVRFCHDMGFVLEPQRPVRLDLGGYDLTRRNRPLVGLNISGLLMMGGYNQRNMFGLHASYAELIDRVIELLIEHKHADVLLVSHVFGEDGESDTVAARHVQSRWLSRSAGRLFRVQGKYDQNEVKHIIGLCDFFIGSRMHACIAALSQGIPAVGIAYSDKFSGVYESVGAIDMVADQRGLTAEQTLAVISGSFDDRAARAAHLRQSMPWVRSRVLGMLNEVA